MESKTVDDLKAVLFTPAGKRLSQAHTGYTTLTLNEVAQLKGYLHEYYEQGGYKPKPIINQIFCSPALCDIFTGIA